MVAFTLRRLAHVLPTLLGITLLTFALLLLAPGDPASSLVSADGAMAPGSSAATESWRELKGLHRSLPQQYANWLWHVLRFDFGRSFLDEQAVSWHLRQALPKTLLLTGCALFLSYLLAIPLGVASALAANRPWERTVSVGLFVLYATPVFWTALVLVVLFAGGEYWQIFPLRGLQSPEMQHANAFARLGDLAWHLVLPAGCLCYPSLVRTSRFQRAAMIEVLHEDYMRTARAKGLRPFTVLARHGLRQGLRPVVALLSVDLPWLFGGSVVIERIFTIRGMGMLTIEAILRRDYPIIMGVTFLVAIVTIVALLLGDILLAALDPRVRERLAE